MENKVELRIYGDGALPTLIYLPGLHGDWTLIGGFREAVNGKVRFVEMTYPRTLDWSLKDYATAIENALAQNGIINGWLLGESFGSQILWAMIARGKFPAQGAILAGGFVRHPMRRAVRLAEKVFGHVSLRLLIWMMFSYAKIARFPYRRSSEILKNINEFIERRTELDRRAAQHRLHLVAESDQRVIAAQVKIPVFALVGFWDPVVPWPRVRWWLKKNCPTLRDYKIIWRGDHNVLGTAPKESASQILEWIGA